MLAESLTNLDHGAKIFEANCAGCHINGGNIVRRGKNLKSKALHKNKVDSEEAIANLVTNGKGIMSAYGDKLSQQEIADVSAYVLQQAAQDWKK
ncbi:MAG: c-type cytochrome [Waterburya sp.]